MHEHTKHHGHPATELHDANGALKDPVCGMAVTSASPNRHELEKDVRLWDAAASLTQCVGEVELMTVATNIFGLLPVLFDTGVGSDVAKRIAAPMWGGLVSLTLLTLLIVPAVYVAWRSTHLPRRTPS